jgi:hypothetical protein
LTGKYKAENSFDRIIGEEKIQLGTRGQSPPDQKWFRKILDLPLRGFPRFKIVSFA